MIDYGWSFSMLRVNWRRSKCIFLNSNKYLRCVSRFASTVGNAGSPTVIPQDVAPLVLRAGVQLRTYQEECVQAVLSAISEGQRRVGISLGTGGGKTVIFTELISRLQSPSPRAKQTLILVHRRELVEQAARHCQQRYPDKTVDIEMGNQHASGVADITIASVQSINSRDRIDKFDPSRFKLVLVDEAHHIVARSYLNILDHFNLSKTAIENEDRVASQSTSPSLVGVSATWTRFDGLALGQAIDHIVYHKDYIDLIEAGWLSKVIFTTVKSNVNLSKVRQNSQGDFSTSALSAAVNNQEANTITVRSWLARASDRKSTLVFCVDHAHLESLTNTFRSHGVDARFITGDTPNKIRNERLEAFRNREYPVLLNCSVFTEGTDVPNIDCVLLARPTLSRGLLQQMIGRGMRLYATKENCHVIDMVASFNKGIVTIPSLFGLDPDELVEDADLGKMQRLRERREFEKKQSAQNRQNDMSSAVAPTVPTSVNISGTVTFTDYDSVNDLIHETSSERYIRALSRNAWVDIGDDRFVLTDQDGSYMTLEHAPPPSSSTSFDSSPAPVYQVTLVRKLKHWDPSSKTAPLTRPRTIAKSETFDGAVRAADTFAKESFQHYMITTLAAGSWRKNPASQAQVDYLNKFRDEHNQLSTHDVTKGAAMDMITKVKFGARGKIKKQARRRKKEEREEGKIKERRERESVKVGPLGGSGKVV